MKIISTIAVIVSTGLTLYAIIEIVKEYKNRNK
jgi:FtsH-binding integral membrane protein